MRKIDIEYVGEGWPDPDSNDQPNIEKLKWDLDKAHSELGKAIDTLRDIYHYGGAMRGQWAQEKTERTLADLRKDVQYDDNKPNND